MAAALALSDEVRLKKYLGRSALFHGLLFAVLFSASYLERQGVFWGGPGGLSGSTSTKVSLVSVAALPLPREPAVTESKAVDPTNSLHKEDLTPKPPEPKTDATKIPKFEKEKRLPPSPKSRTLENKTPEVDNAVPGNGGTPNLPTSYAQTPGPSSGVNAQGPGGSDFGARYPWYVDAVRSRVQQSWDQSAIASTRTVPYPTSAWRKAVATLRWTIRLSGLCKVSMPSGRFPTTIWEPMSTLRLISISP